mmetsp:Transcript_24023/g.21053  ORF Transcript_24023/g.21053 Transcript_24023/m.21053 type:complete len:234 (+) Transcript_24023:25-726(+)
MDESDLVYQLRVSFHLGNNIKVIELAKEYSSMNMTSDDSLGLTILYRALVKMGNNFTKYIDDLNLRNHKAQLKMCFDYIAPLNKQVTTEEANKLYTKFKSSVTEDSPVARLIESLLLIAKKDYEAFMKLDPESKSIERWGMLFQCFMQLHRVDLMEKALNKMKNLPGGSEDVLTSLCEIYHKIYARKYEDALDMIEVTKGTFEEAAKLLNLRATVLMLMGNFKEAQSLLSKLQ